MTKLGQGVRSYGTLPYYLLIVRQSLESGAGSAAGGTGFETSLMFQ